MFPLFHTSKKRNLVEDEKAKAPVVEKKAKISEQKTTTTTIKTKTIQFEGPVPGLTVVENFITQEEHDQLLAQISKLPWSTELKRKVQHYGYCYNYSQPSKTPQPTTSIPAFFDLTLSRLVSQGHFDSQPDQIINNMYLPGEGIAGHIDHIKHFGPVIASLTLQSHCVMLMTKYGHKEHLQKSILLKPRSLIVLKGDARYKWLHSIDKIKEDVLKDGQVLARGTRISSTFRTMKNQKKHPKPTG